MHYVYSICVTQKIKACTVLNFHISMQLHDLYFPCSKYPLLPTRKVENSYFLEFPRQARSIAITISTLKATITTAADDSLEQFCIVFQRDKT